MSPGINAGGLTKTFVRVVRGRYGGRLGLIAGDLASQNPYATRAAVFIGADVAVLNIADLEALAQLELQLPGPPQTKTPPARSRRRFVGISPW